jgi:2',3'-cyclic-nucleotide 2'-phosphodiesterase (5'-nucleotidase family)
MAGDIKIMIAGLTPPNLKYICLPSNTAGVNVMEWFDSPLSAINIEKEKRQAQILILLSQESLGKKDEKLIKALNNNHIDLFVGTDFARKGIVRETQNGYTITFPGHNRGQRIGVTDLSYSKSRGIFAISTNFKTVETSVEEEKPSMRNWLKEAIDKHRSKLDEEIATIAAPLDRQFFGEGDTGNLVADAIKEATNASIVCINSGGVATPLEKGPIRLRDFYTLIPFENKIVSFNIKGTDLLTFLRETLGKGSPLQVAGIKLEMRSIEGERGYELTNIKVDDLPVNPDKVYSFATNDFVKGRSPQLIAIGPINESSLVRDCVINFLRKHSPYSPPGKSRIVINE